MNKMQHQQEWADAIRRCHLSTDAVRMAKELGFSPKSLIKNIPSPQQPWKASVEEWVRELYAKREHKRPQKLKRKAKAAARQASPAAGVAGQPKQGDHRGASSVDAAASTA